MCNYLNVMNSLTYFLFSKTWCLFNEDFIWKKNRIFNMLKDFSVWITSLFPNANIMSATSNSASLLLLNSIGQIVRLHQAKKWEHTWYLSLRSFESQIAFFFFGNHGQMCQSGGSCLLTQQRWAEPPWQGIWLRMKYLLYCAMNV